MTDSLARRKLASAAARLNASHRMAGLLPPLVLLGGGLALWMYARRRSKGGPDVAPAALTADEQARLAALMSTDAPAK